MSDQSVGELVTENFVPVYQQVGQFVSTSRVNSESVGKQGGNVVTYFCTPDLRVLGWVVGPVTPEHLLAEAKQALAADHQISRVSHLDAKTQRQRIHDHYLSQLHPQNRQAARLWSEFNKDSDRAPSEQNVARILWMARKTRDTPKRPGSPVTIKQVKAYRNDESHLAVRLQRDTEGSDLCRMVISEFPSLQLQHVQRTVFETLANQKFEPRSDRNDSLLKGVNDSVAAHRPTMLVVDEYINDFQSSAKRSGVSRLLKNFTVLKLSRKELTRLADDLNQSPVEASQGSLRMVILDPHGDRTGVIMSFSPAGSSRRRYLSVLRDPAGRPQTHLTSLLIAELELATNAD